MSRESIDITDQIESGFELPSSGSKYNNTGKQGHRLPLGVKLTGYRLLNVAVILAFGIWKAISTYLGVSVIPTTLDLVGGTFLAIISYYIGLFQDTRPEICPLFFQVDWAPLILKFVGRSEVHRFLLSLSPLQPAVALLQFAQEVRGAPGFKNGSLHFERSASSSIIIRNATMVAAAWIFLGTLAALQHLTKVVYRLRVLHSFLTQDIVCMSLLVVWAASQSYITSDVTVEFVPTEPTERHVSFGQGYDISRIVTMGHVMTTAPIIFLLESIEFKNASRFLRLIKGRATLQRITERFAVVVRIMKRILWGLFRPYYLVALLITLARNFKQPHYVLHLSIMIIVFSRHFLTSLPTSWRSAIADVHKAVRSAVRSAGSAVYDYSLRMGLYD